MLLKNIFSEVAPLLKFLFIVQPVAGILLSFIAIFPLVGIYMIWYGFHTRDRLVIAKTWPKTKGIIISSKAVGAGGGSGSQRALYTPDIHFKFKVDNKEYVSDKIEWGGSIQANSLGMIEGYCAKYPFGSEVTVSYNPLKPSDCVVETDPSFISRLPFVVGIVFIILGIGFFIPSSLSMLNKYYQYSNEPHDEKIIGIVREELFVHDSLRFFCSDTLPPLGSEEDKYARLLDEESVVSDIAFCFEKWCKPDFSDEQIRFATIELKNKIIKQSNGKRISDKSYDKFLIDPHRRELMRGLCESAAKTKTP